MRRPAPRLTDREPAAEQRLYAALLRLGTGASIAVIVLTFLLYIGGVIPPLIPIRDLPQYWGLGAREYLRRAGVPAGWGWVRLVRFGDFMNYIGVVMLTGLTIACYMAIFPGYLRKRDTPYILIVLGEVAVLLLAASGLLGGGQ